MRAALALAVGLLASAGIAGAGCADDAASPGALGPDAAADAGRNHDAPANEGAVKTDAGAFATVDYPFDVPVGFPKPLVPADNPLTREKAELGRHLFYDARLSGNGTTSCGSCHEQRLAFTDGRPHGIGSTGQVHPRGSMSLVNVAYATSLTWANPMMATLELQANVPMFGIDPVELGLLGKDDEVLTRLRAEPRYAALFAAAYPADGDPFTMTNVTKAIASFERTILSGNSRFDRWLNRGETSALTAEEIRGYDVFNSETVECFHCHAGFALTDAVSFAGASRDPIFHNTGLYNLGGTGAYPAATRGLIDVTEVASDMGRFKAPTLRNIAVTAPYMHDGSIATLEEVLDHYAAGGRTIPSGPNAGVGHDSPYKSGLIVSFALSADDRAALLAFLRSLTDEELLTSAAYADPWR